MKVSISNKAHRNISSIFEYILEDSLKYANETVYNKRRVVYCTTP